MPYGSMGGMSWFSLRSLFSGPLEVSRSFLKPKPMLMIRFAIGQNCDFRVYTLAPLVVLCGAGRGRTVEVDSKDA
jgi:hypothetical protein